MAIGLLFIRIRFMMVFMEIKTERLSLVFTVEKEIEFFIWGNNKEKRINWHKMFVWSNGFLKIMRSESAH